MMNAFSQGPPHQLYKQTWAYLSLDSMRLKPLSSGWAMQTLTPPLLPCHLPHHLLNILHHPPQKVILPCLSPTYPTCPQLEQLKMRHLQDPRLRRRLTECLVHGVF